MCIGGSILLEWDVDSVVRLYRDGRRLSNVLVGVVV